MMKSLNVKLLIRRLTEFLVSVAGGREVKVKHGCVNSKNEEFRKNNTRSILGVLLYK